MLNRLSQATYTDGQSVDYTYDQGLHALGRLSTVTHTEGQNSETISYSYDLYGAITQDTRTIAGVGYTTAYRHDSHGRPSGIVYPSGLEVTYTYDGNGQVQKIQASKDGHTTTVADAIAYQPFGGIASFTNGHGQTYQRSYDQDGGIASYTLAGQPHTLSYDPASRIEAITNIGQFTYDDLDRLTGAATDQNYSYDYDANGNRQYRAIAGNRESYSIDPSNNQLQSIDGRPYTHDANGAITNDGRNTYHYDARGRMVQADTAQGSAHYHLNPLGQRTVKDTAQGITVYHYDLSGRLIAEGTPDGTISKEYLWLGNLPLAVSSQESQGSGSGDEVLLDNTSAQFTIEGTWQSSTVVSGYYGNDYLAITPNGVAQGQAVDNTDPGFTAAGPWESSTAITGYQGSDYLVLAPNSLSPDATIIDNGDPGTTTTGDWTSSTVVAGYQGSDYQYHSANGPLVGGIVLDNQDGTGASTWKSSASIAGYEGQDYQAHPAGDGSEPYQWTTAVAGSYVVYAKWTSHPNRATRATYTITHANGTTEVTINQQENGGQWNPLGTYTFDQQVQIQLSDQADGTVIADALLLVPADAQPSTATWTAPTTPGSYQIYAKWTAHPNRATNATYTVEHINGTTDVTVDQQQHTGAWYLLGSYTFDQHASIHLTDRADGTVIADAIALVPTDAQPNTATWTHATTPGDYQVYARWTQHQNRTAHATYTITHANATTEVTVDQQTNGGQWQSLGSYTFDQHAQIQLTGQNDGTTIADAITLVPVNQTNGATWTPKQTGEYAIYARWTEHPNRATDAAYTVTHAGGSQTVTVNQQTNGGQWNLLGTYTLDGQSTIQLSDRANGYVIADALKLVPTQASSTTTAWTLNYIHADHLGTPRVVTDGQGQTIWSWPLNEPFGDNGVNEDVDGDGKTFTLNLRFPGQYYDQETGLSYNYFRTYDPSTGRYLESDPIGLDGGLNTYLYAEANPLRFTDPTGEAAIALPWVVPPLIEGLKWCAAALAFIAITETCGDEDGCFGRDDDDDDKCDKKLSDAFLRQLGIDAHAIKRAMVPGGGWGAYNLCGCKDGRILLKRSKDCKDPGGEDTGERWK